MHRFTYLLLFLIALALITLISKILYLYYLNKKLHKYTDNLKHGILTLEDVHDLSPNEFEHWCALFLDKQGFSNIKVTPVGHDGGKDIICYKDSKKYYVECKRYFYSNSAKYKVDIEIARKLVGAMEGDCIENGIIMTSGIIEDKVIDYVNSLPEKFNISLYHGKDLIKDHNTLLKLSLIPNLASKN